MFARSLKMFVLLSGAFSFGYWARLAYTERDSRDQRTMSPYYFAGHESIGTELLQTAEKETSVVLNTAIGGTVSENELSAAAAGLAELDDPHSHLSFMANAGQALEPLLLAQSNPLGMALGRRVLKRYMDTEWLSDNELLVVSRGHFEEPGAMPSRQIAMSGLVQALQKAHTPLTNETLARHWQRVDISGLKAAEKALDSLSDEELKRAVETTLRSPVGDERRLWSATAAPLLRRPAGLVPSAALDAGDAQLTLARARLATKLRELLSSPSTEVWAARRLAVLNGDWQPLLDVSSRLSAAADFHMAVLLLTEANQMAPRAEPVLQARAALEQRLLRRLLDKPEALYAGPGPEFPEVTLMNPGPTDFRRLCVGGFELVQDGNRLAYRLTDLRVAVRARLDLARWTGVPMPNAQALLEEAQEISTRWDWAAAWWGALSSFGMLLLALFRWGRRDVGRMLIELGLLRVGARMVRWGMGARRSFQEDYEAARALLALAERDAHQRSTLCNEVRTFLHDAETSLGLGLSGRAAFLGEDFDAARVHFHDYFQHTVRLERWLEEQVRLENGILEYRAGRYAEALRHGRLAGRRGAVLAGAASLRSQNPSARGLLVPALFGPDRMKVRRVLAHVLIDLGKLRLAHWASRLVPRTDSQRQYIQARWLEASGHVNEAREVFSRLPHSGARLGVAFLDPSNAGLSELAAEHSEAGQQALTVLASRLLEQGQFQQAVDCLESNNREPNVPLQAELLGCALARMGEARRSAAAFDLFPDHKTVDRHHALAVAALGQGDWMTARALLEDQSELWFSADVLNRAEWGLALARFRRCPEEGLEAAARHALGRQVSNGEWLGIPVRLLSVLTLLARRKLGAAKTELQRKYTNDLLGDWLRAILEGAEVDVVRKASTAVRSAFPQLANLVTLIEATSFADQGLVQDARRSLLESFNSTVGDEASARLSASLGVGDKGLSLAFNLALQGRFSESAEVLDAVSGAGLSQVRALRLGVAAQAARNRLLAGDRASAIHELERGVEQLGVTSSEGGRLMAAACLLDGRKWRSMPVAWSAHVLQAHGQFDDRRDQFVMTTCAVVDTPSMDHVERFLSAVTSLIEDRGLMATHRLRALDLVGEKRMSSIPFEERVLGQIHRMVVDMLIPMVEMFEVSDLTRMLAPLVVCEHNVIASIRQDLAVHQIDSLRQKIDEATEVATTVEDLDSALDVLRVFDLDAKRYLSVVRSLGTAEEVTAEGTDLLAACFETMAIGFYNRIGCNKGSVRAMNVALEFERSAEGRRRMQSNRAIMSGPSNWSR